ncbi:DUF5301 domain-containing protein [Enterococcus sp. AD013-P3]
MNFVKKRVAIPLYIFEENGKVYIERPYDGIYRSNRELMTRIKQIVDN